MFRVLLSFFIGISLVLPGVLKAEPANENNDDKYLTIQSMVIEQLDENALGNPLLRYEFPLDTLVPRHPVDEADYILDKIINMYKKVWAVVEENKPVVNIKEDRASALPEGAYNWRNLEGWATPKSRTYRVRYRNFYGWDVVNFAFRVIYTYGGSVNGVGRYLTNVTVIPAHLDVSWGYTFNASVEVPYVTNAGTKTNPLAGMEVHLKWSVDTIIKHNRMASSYYLRGDGLFKSLGAL